MTHWPHGPGGGGDSNSLWVDENEARSVAQDGSESSSTSDTTPATSFSLHATTDPSSLRSPVAVCVLALGVTCSNGGNSNGKLDAQHSTAQHSGEIGGELTIQRPDSTAVMSLVYLALSSLTTPTTNPSASATVSRSGRTLPCIAHCDGRRPAPVGRVVASGNNFDIVLDVQTQNNYCGTFFVGGKPAALHDSTHGQGVHQCEPLLLTTK
ncbi:uncharacterized protein LOC123509262 [Portunus trituberculatus]|uniref:uncharacterized protein LOC123509262 n=1 Tax=Portunus trituberculatus TaxID=210409 RepID=UPI001E1D2031|nr:uncharacterized protein LOC123509262 [Portunus trituberculatus]